MNASVGTPVFPDRLLDWAGHRSGGVRKLFHEQASRPSGAVIRTGLLERLESWVSDLISGKPETPRVVLLVGGPGNGKTEAIEACIRRLDQAGGLQGTLVEAVSAQFSAGTGRPVPRLASFDLGKLTDGRLGLQLEVVQDASVEDAGRSDKTPPQLLLADLEEYVLAEKPNVYVACVNRGVLDDAFSASIDSAREKERILLAQIIRSVGLTWDVPPCWPLEGYPDIAVWPMDVESLLVPTAAGDVAPARRLLDIATNESDWAAVGNCAAGDRCPHCNSRAWLGDDRRRTSLLKLLHWYELASGKRWSFRDLGSLLSFLLAGGQGSEQGRAISPCEAAARLVALDSSAETRRTPQALQAPYLLVASHYEHALFGKWPRESARALRRDIKELGLENDATLMGLYHFLNRRRHESIPSTLERQLEGLCDLLDPAVADPDDCVQVSSRTELALRDIDARFSQSVADGLSFIGPYRALAPAETELLKRLARADQILADPSLRNRRPTAAERVQLLVREFSCRLVRRSIGVQSGMARDARVLASFEQVIGGDEELLHRTVRQVEKLLNEHDQFKTSLNTTFGEPSPPIARQTILTTQKQIVRPLGNPSAGRPIAALRFLRVGNRGAYQSVALTFELFKSVTELGNDLLPAVLPRTVVALLDATRARLSGRIVRDEELLDGAEMRIGRRNEAIVRELGRFVVRRDGKQ
jgi:hypothetical protein